MIERLHPKHPVLEHDEWRRTQEKIDELVDAVNLLTNRLEDIEIMVFAGPGDDDAWGTEPEDWEDDDDRDDNLCHCADVNVAAGSDFTVTPSDTTDCLFSEFAAYIAANPGLRFWQAVRNFSGYNFIFGSTANAESYDDYSHLEDTFNLTTKGPKKN